MAHESFEDEQTAAIMNEHLVAVKVDREERPDVDAIYMTATQAMTGQGGWPMTVFMTPGPGAVLLRYLLPAGAFPAPGARGGQGLARGPGRRGGQAREIAAALAGQSAAAVNLTVPGTGAGPEDGAGPLAAACDAAVATLAGEYDAVRGGFGGAPKFPPSMVCEFLLRHSERAGRAADARALEMAAATASAMARGGMYDQLAGGFARYSVDAGLGRAALREDALRQRPAGPAVHPPVAADRRRAGPPGGRGDLRVA